MYGLRQEKLMPPDAPDFGRYREEEKPRAKEFLDDHWSSIYDSCVYEDGGCVVFLLAIAEPEEATAIAEFLDKMDEGGDPTSAAYKLYNVLKRIDRRNR